MDALSYIKTDVADMAVTMDVYRKDDSGAYSGDWTLVDTKNVHVFAPSSSSRVVVEGSGQETSLTGLTLPTYDTNDTLVDVIHVNDQLRYNGKRYDVRVKDGLPNELDPELWKLGLDRANATE